MDMGNSLRFLTAIRKGVPTARLVKQGRAPTKRIKNDESGVWEAPQCADTVEQV